MIENQSILDLYALSYKTENYPPVAGKILGLFFISNQKYFTFEEIMDALNASKSATSKAIKLLIKEGKVNFKFQEDNKRKRYFYMDIQGTIEHNKMIAKSLHLQIELYKKTLKFRNSENEELSQFIQDNINFNIELVKHGEKLIQKHFIK